MYYIVCQGKYVNIFIFYTLERLLNSLIKNLLQLNIYYTHNILANHI